MWYPSARGPNLLLIVSASELPPTRQENCKVNHVNICEILLWCKRHRSICLLGGKPTGFKWAAQRLCTYWIGWVSQAWESVMEKQWICLINKLRVVLIVWCCIQQKFMQNFLKITARRKGSWKMAERETLSKIECGLDFSFWEAIQVTLTESRDTFQLGFLCAQCNGKAVQDQFICVKIWPCMSLEVNETTVDLLRACWSLL